jgi:transcriptional regulator of NAD metabolism
MIDRYTVKVNPAVSQKEVVKLLNDGKSVKDLAHLHKLKARVELIGSPEDVEKLVALLKELAAK